MAVAFLQVSDTIGQETKVVRSPSQFSRDVPWPVAAASCPGWWGLREAWESWRGAD